MQLRPGYARCRWPTVGTRWQVAGCLALWVLVAQMRRGMELDVKPIHKAITALKAKVHPHTLP